MNKFLNFCFKFGKWFVSIILVLLLIAGFCLGISAIKNDLKASDYTMNYKFGSEGTTKQPQNSAKDTSTAENNEKAYKESIIKAFGDNKPADYFANKVAQYVDKKVEDRDVKDFIGNLPAYYESAKAAIFEELRVNRRLNDSQLQEFYKNLREDFDDEILNRYASRYSDNVQSRAAHEAKSLTARNTSLMALLVVLGMFILALIVPVLIKIEENTRK